MRINNASDFARSLDLECVKFEERENLDANDFARRKKGCVDLVMFHDFVIGYSFLRCFCGGIGITRSFCPSMIILAGAAESNLKGNPVSSTRFFGR